jgi:RNA-directed DNA polymerase
LGTGNTRRELYQGVRNFVRSVCSPVISNLGLDGLDAVVPGNPWHRGVHTSNVVRWADDVSVTANARQVFAARVLPRVTAFFAARGVRLSAEKTVIPPLAQGFDVFGPTSRTHERPPGQPATRHIVPSRASSRAINTQLKALGTPAKGRSPAQLIEPLNAVLRGGANDHRHVIWRETFRQLDSFVWRRFCRGAKWRHPNTTGRWIAERSFPPNPGESWRVTDPDTGTQIRRLREVVNPPRHHQVKGEATPFDPAWAAYFQHRDRQLLRQAASPFRAKILTHQSGLCPGCRQVLQGEEALERPHRDGNHQHTRLANLVLFPPNCHRQVHDAPDRQAASLRPAQGVGHA